MKGSIICPFLHVIEEKTIENVKNLFRVALKSTGTRNSQPCPLCIGCALVKTYGDLFYTPKSLPHFTFSNVFPQLVFILFSWCS